MTGLLGRDHDLRAALAVLDPAGDDEAVLVEGAAGIGKTRILDAVVERARSVDVDVLITRPAEAESEIPLLAFRDLMDQLGPSSMGVLPGPQRERLEVALGAGTLPTGQELDEAMVALAVFTVLRARARRTPLLLAIDDVQWLDASSSTVLEMALRRLQGQQVRVIATWRSAVPAKLDLVRIFRDRLRRVSLDGLSVGALRELIASRLGRSLPRPVLLRLHELTEGNPLHALELARTLPPDSRPGDALGAAVPPDLGALLGGRVEGLSRAAQDVVAVVALAPRADVATIAAALGLEPEVVERAGDAAVEAGLLAERPWGYGLSHPLVGAASTARIGTARRRSLHRALADVVEDPEQSAIHRARATVGPDGDVADALEQAAERVLARGATVDAAELLDRAIKLTPPASEEPLVRRRLALARALMLAGDTHGAFAEFNEIRLDAIPDPSTRAEAVLLLGVVQRYLGEHDAAIAGHEEALGWDLAPRTRGRVYLRLAWHIERDLAAGLRYARSAIELLDPEEAPLDHAFAALALARLELALGVRADHAGIARAHELQGAAIGRGWDVSTMPIDWAVWMDDWVTARSLLRTAVEAADDSGDETTLGHLIRRQAEVETWSGTLAEAERLVTEAIERATASQQHLALASARARRGLIRALQGRLDEAERDGEAGLAAADARRVPIIAAYALTALAHAARLRDDHRRVDALLARATAMLDATGDIDHSAFRFHSDHLDALVALSELDRAGELVARLERRGALGPRRTWSGVAERGHAAIALAEGRLDDAAAHAERALRLHADGLVPLEAARTRMAAAEIERRSGRRKAAAAHLREALVLVERLGAEGWAARIRPELERLAPDQHDLANLTPSEERIASLAAAGLRNREIAARLAISEKTVEASLGRVYSKLAIRSRAQLAAGLARTARGEEPGSS